jgi:predicted outer membrane protein
VHGAAIGAARTVSPRLTSEPARVFARAMLVEHVAMDSALRLLPIRRDTMAQPPAQFATMQAATSAQSAIWVTMPSGPALDRAYVAAQVTAHAQALDSLKHWRADVRDGTVAASLDDAIGRVQGQLQRARALQQTLGGADSAAAGQPALPLPLTPERAETPGSPLGRQMPDTSPARLIRRPPPTPP